MAPTIWSISAAGNVDHDIFVALVEQAFAALPRTSAVSEVPSLYSGGDFRETRKLEQVHLVLGFGGLAFNDPDFYNLGALSTLLGEGMSSRLFQEIREKRGLAYSVYSFHSGFTDSGHSRSMPGRDRRIEGTGACRVR
jgi:predicted Zn-dependent peptidase